MAVTSSLISSRLRIKTKDGVLASGKNKVKSYTMTGLAANVTPESLKAVSDAVATVITNEVLENVRVDESLIAEQA